MRHTPIFANHLQCSTFPLQLPLMCDRAYIEESKDSFHDLLDLHRIKQQEQVVYMDFLAHSWRFLISMKAPPGLFICFFSLSFVLPLFLQ